MPCQRPAVTLTSAVRRHRHPQRHGRTDVEQAVQHFVGTSLESAEQVVETPVEGTVPAVIIDKCEYSPTGVKTHPARVFVRVRPAGIGDASGTTRIDQYRAAPVPDRQPLKLPEELPQSGRHLVPGRRQVLNGRLDVHGPPDTPAAERNCVSTRLITITLLAVVRRRPVHPRRCSRRSVLRHRPQCRPQLTLGVPVRLTHAEVHTIAAIPTRRPALIFSRAGAVPAR
jgi:hypothetical protein